jgi:hypothetical protein
MSPSCFHFVPENTHLLETLIWLLISTVVMVMCKLPKVLKILVVESRKELRKPVPSLLSDFLFVGFFGSYYFCCVVFASIQGPSWNHEFFSQHAVFTAVLISMLTAKKHAFGSILGFISIPFMCKYLFISAFSSTGRTLPFGLSSHSTVLDTISFFIATIHLLSCRNYFLYRMINEVDYLIYLPFWIVVQMNCVYEVRQCSIVDISDASFILLLCSTKSSLLFMFFVLYIYQMLGIIYKINVDMILCPSTLSTSHLLDHVYPVFSPVHSFRSVVMFLQLALLFVFVLTSCIVVSILKERHYFYVQGKRI